MNKTQIIKWLERKQADSISEIDNKYTETLNAYISKRNEKLNLDSTADKIIELYEKIETLLDNWVKEVSQHDGFSMNQGYYNTMRRKIYGCTDKDNIVSLLEREFTDNSEIIKSMNKTYENTKAEIKKNYINVIENVRGMKNAKVALEYLESLGFDLSDLKQADEQPTTALVAQVDTRYLFIGGIGNER